jgi:hypothetical protein
MLQNPDWRPGWGQTPYLWERQPESDVLPGEFRPAVDAAQRLETQRMTVIRYSSLGFQGAIISQFNVSTGYLKNRRVGAQPKTS